MRHWVWGRRGIRRGDLAKNKKRKRWGGMLGVLCGSVLGLTLPQPEKNEVYLLNNVDFFFSFFPLHVGIILFPSWHHPFSERDEGKLMFACISNDMNLSSEMLN